MRYSKIHIIGNFTLYLKINVSLYMQLQSYTNDNFILIKYNLKPFF